MDVEANEVQKEYVIMYKKFMKLLMLSVNWYKMNPKTCFDEKSLSY